MPPYVNLLIVKGEKKRKETRKTPPTNTSETLDWRSLLRRRSTPPQLPLAQPPTTSADLNFLNCWKRGSIRPRIDCSYCWRGGPSLLGSISSAPTPTCNRERRMNCETCQLKELVRFLSHPPASVSLRFFWFLSPRWFWLISFVLVCWLFGPQELEQTEIRDVLRCESWF